MTQGAHGGASPEVTARAILDSGAYNLASDLGDMSTWYTWSSGIRAPTYTDCREIQSHIGSYATIITQLEKSIRALVPIETFDAIVGIANGGLVWSAPLALNLQKDHAYVRRTPKIHGTRRLIEGTLPRHTRCLIVDDLLATAATVLSAMDALQTIGIETIGVHTIVNWRLPEVDRLFDHRGLLPLALVGYVEILDAAEERGLISTACHKEMLFFYQRPFDHQWDLTALTESDHPNA